MWKQIQANRRRSAILVTMMVILLMGVGSLVAFPWGVLTTAGILVGLTGIYFRAADRFILKKARLFIAKRTDNAQVLNLVEEISIAAGLGFVPRVFILNDPAPNAFAVGRKLRSSVIVVTSGLVQKLNRDELQGVIAHEVAHIQNRDVQFMTLASALLGVAVMLAVGLKMVIYGNLWVAKVIGVNFLDALGIGSEVPEFVRRIGGVPQVILMIIPYVLLLAIVCLVALPFFIVGELLQKILYFACSRKREFLADACAVQYTRYPEGLASALEKIAKIGKRPAFADGSTSPLFIVNPMRIRWRGWLGRLFTTHPPTSDRIAILRNMVGSNLVDYEKAYQQTTHKFLGSPLRSAN